MNVSKAVTESTWIPYEPTEVLPPGETLRETLDALEMSQQKLAQRTGLSPKHINQIIQGQSALTHETAIALERATGVPASFWNTLESNYRDYEARRRERTQLTSESSWLKKMPLAALRKQGVIVATARDPGAQLQQVLQFFGVSSIEAWQEVWAQPSASFLQSASFTADEGAVAAWLRLGEIAATQVKCDPFSRVRLRSLLPDLRGLTVEPPAIFWPELKRLCASAGVAVVIEEEVRGARASGATRWISPNKAIVQLSNRGKRNDKFWFALFHELGHVLLHGKKEVFVEYKIGYDGGRLSQEAEANDFARDLLIPRDSVRTLAGLQTSSDVRAFAHSIGIAPGIVAGRLQRDREDWTYGQHPVSLFEKFEIERSNTER